ncbi:MAG TPA: methyltransferase domain-containing protein [Chitinophagales bacterium]|nr:methyltransferase domain-containing protein [Chitinophagales bacterium]HRK26635.1 methyltransferase domain-containing protein [Chitinophagales bacterium]
MNNHPSKLLPTLIALFTALLSAAAVYVGWHRRKKQNRQHKPEQPDHTNLTNANEVNYTAQDVGQFYDQYTDKFLQVYGKVIQAFRTKEVHKLLDYEAQSMGLMPQNYVLDAGCGVCAPAIYFAQNYHVQIEALTISEVQAVMATAAVAEAGLEDKIKVTTGDFQQLNQIYPAGVFDVVYFLESFGHAPNQAAVLQSVWQVLKPGGVLYIKDLFKKVAPLPQLQPQIDAEITKINQAYHYNVPNLYHILDQARKLGFVVMSLKTIDIPLEDFENLTISNDFQELTGVGKIAGWDGYIFPIDFFELKCYKPLHEPDKGLSRYFLQNLFYLQVQHKKISDL